MISKEEQMKSVNYKLRLTLLELRLKIATELDNKEILLLDNSPMFSKDCKISELQFQLEANKRKAQLLLPLLLMMDKLQLL